MSAGSIMVFGFTSELREITRRHREIDPGIVGAYRVMNIDGPGILFVNTDLVDSDIDFCPLGFDHPFGLLRIMETTPQKFQWLQNGFLQLPHGWKIGESLLD